MKKTIVSLKNYHIKQGEELQTEKIQAAIDFCYNVGGGEVEIPSGTYYTGGILLRTNVCLHLLKDAKLVGSKNPDDYNKYLDNETERKNNCKRVSKTVSPGMENKGSEYSLNHFYKSRWSNALIKAINAENISIIGEEGAVINGNDCFDEKGEEHYRGPHCVCLFKCKNVSLSGYTIEKSANWGHAIFFTTNVMIHDVSVLGGHDGIHLRGCSNTNISNCKLYTGDDCIAGFSNTNVYIDNCVLNSSCSAFRFGGTNVFIEKCNIFGPGKYLFRGSLSESEKTNGVKQYQKYHRNNMLSVFTYFADFSVDIDHQPGNIIIGDCVIKAVDRLLHYNFSGNERWQRNRPLENISIRDTKVSDIGLPIVLYGSEEEKVSFELINTDISISEDAKDIPMIYACNYKKLLLKHVAIRNFEGNVLVKTWSDDKVTIEDLLCVKEPLALVNKAQEDFQCKPI